MTTQTITHPGLERLSASYSFLSGAVLASASAIRAWGGWSRMASTFERWGEARVHALAMQDPRIRSEILAAALRQEREQA
jgi:hypothetical protein